LGKATLSKGILGKAMRRRDFLTLVAAGAMARPGGAGAEPGGVRRVGVLMNTAADFSEGSDRIALFAKGLREGGWEEGRNIQVETR
jgi:hypothetical protein